MEGVVTGFEKGEALGLEKGKAEIIRNSWKAGIPVETLAVISGFTVEEVQAILDA